MIACGRAEGGSGSSSSEFSRFVQNLLPSPLAYGVGDVDFITGTETYPNITQSETFSWVNPDNPLHVMVAYNDSRGVNATPINLSGASVSTDGGNTFIRLTNASGQSPFASAGINIGDPVVLYNRQSQTWFTIWLDCGCDCGIGFGSSGLGYYKSTAPWDANSNPQAGNFCSAAGQSPLGNSSLYQQFTVPVDNSTLNFWYWTCSADFINFDWQDAYITDTNGNILQTLFHQCTDNEVWVHQAVNMSPYAGQTVRLKFLVHQDGSNSYLTGMYVDDVTLTISCGTPSPTPTMTPSSTPTPTTTVSPSPTMTPSTTATPRRRPTPRPHFTPVRRL